MKLKRGRVRSDARKRGMKKTLSFIFTKRSEGGGWQLKAEIEMTGMDVERNETKRQGQMRREEKEGNVRGAGRNDRT